MPLRMWTLKTLYAKWNKAVTKKNKYYMTPLTWGTQGSKIQRQEKKKRWLSGVGGRGQWGVIVSWVQSFRLERWKHSGDG